VLYARTQTSRKKALDGLRLIGAFLLSIVVIYFLGYGLGLYGSN